MKFDLQTWDWIFLIWFLGVTVGVGLYYTKRAGSNLKEYFLSGRNLPWWALGTSMVATSFAADTPIVVTGFVLSQGIAGNWLWWNFLIGGTLTVFVFSRLWRRAEITTEIELIRIRYHGRPAHFLRGFKAVYLGLIVNAIIFGWVTRAMSQVLEVVFGVNQQIAVGILIGLTLIYTLLSGLWGVVASDVLQFAMAMVGSVMLAGLAVAEVGGLPNLIQGVRELEVEYGRNILDVFPSGWDAFSYGVLILILVNWWAVYYPGAEPGGGGYVAQRMFAARDENHARAGTFWYMFVHYVIRPWPWILVALAAAVLEPRFLAGHTDGPYVAEQAYPWMFRLLPVGILGLVIAAFFAAFMSTITSLLNLSASYLVNDLYLPFFAKSKTTDKRQVLVARCAVATVTATGCWISWQLQNAGSGWALVMNATAGTGLVLVLRWLWWRINAWSEISAMVGSGLICGYAYSTSGEQQILSVTGADAAILDQVRLLVIVAATTLVWLAATFLTAPTERGALENFYRKIRPGGWWKPVAAGLGMKSVPLTRDMLLWVSSTMFIFGSLVGTGALLLQQWGSAVVFLPIAAVGGLVLYLGLRREIRQRL